MLVLNQVMRREIPGEVAATLSVSACRLPSQEPPILRLDSAPAISAQHLARVAPEPIQEEHHNVAHTMFYNVPEHSLVLSSIVTCARGNVGEAGDRLKMMLLAETGEDIVLDFQGDLEHSRLARSAHSEVSYGGSGTDSYSHGEPYSRRHEDTRYYACCKHSKLRACPEPAEGFPARGPSPMGFREPGTPPGGKH